MQGVRPHYLIALGAVVLLALGYAISNPYKQYSSSQYWADATAADVADVPAEALRPGNDNGPVVMWAAMSTDDPAIVQALVDRGADINEVDETFGGTPLTAVAAQSSDPRMLDALVDLGANLHVRVRENRTALMLAARFNRNPGMARRLVELGIDPAVRDDTGLTALDHARQAENGPVVEELTALSAR